MPKFELFIPKSEKLPMDMRLRLDAETWIDALRAGLAKVGIGGMQTESILCDIKEDNSIHVTDTRTGRVFRILELPATEAAPVQPAAPVAPAAPIQPAAPVAPAAPIQPAAPVAPAAPVQPAAPVAPAAPIQPAAPVAPAAPAAPPVQVQVAPPQERPAPPPPRTVPAEPERFTSQPTTPQMSAVKRPDEVRAKAEAQAAGLGLQPAKAAKPAKKAKAPTPPAEAPTTPSSSQVIGRSITLTSEATADMLEEVFSITGELDTAADRDRAMYRMLDLAMEKIGTDAGTVFAADINKVELEFAAVRGPKAREVSRFKVRMGQGIVGFCCQENLGLAVSDVTRDPRFCREISERIGYPTRSILCVPLRVEERVVGALELINKKSSDLFSERDLGLANFIAQHLARVLVPV